MEENIIIHADCLEVLRAMPDKCVDLVLTDPPYGINAENMQMGSNPNRKDGWKHHEGTAVRLRKGRLNQGSGKLKNRALNTMDCSWDFEPPTAEHFAELFRVSQNQIVWGGNYFDLPPTRGIICWDKLQPWENFSAWEMAWTSFDVPASKFAYSSTGGANAEKKFHPTQKPVQLFKWCVAKFSKPGALVLDPFCGSGTTALACHALGRRFICVDRELEYVNAARNRLREAQAQGDLFLESGQTTNNTPMQCALQMPNGTSA